MLRNNHEEADTKVSMHAKAADTLNRNVVIYSSDTDISVILLYYFEKFSEHIWMTSVLHPSIIEAY